MSQGSDFSCNFCNAFKLSDDEIITADDTSLDHNCNSSLAPDEQFNWDEPTLTIPEQTEPGDYNIGILVDHDNVVPESNGYNKYVSSLIEAGSLRTPPPAPIAQDPGDSVSFGESYTVSWSSVEHATQYVIREATSPDFTSPITYYETGTSLTFAHNVTSRTTFYYRVAAHYFYDCEIVDGCLTQWSTTVDMVVEPLPGFIQGFVRDVNTGAPIAGSTVVLDNSQQQSAATDISGAFMFEEVAPGTYTLTASASNYDEASQEVEVAANQTSTVVFSLVPTIFSLTAAVSPTNPAPGQSVTLTALVSDPGGARVIVDVTADLSPIGLSERTALTRSNDIWSVSFTIPADAPLGRSVLLIRAWDSSGTSVSNHVSLEISAEFSGMVTAARPQTHTFENLVPGQTLILQFGSYGGSRLLRLACTTQMTVEGPDGSLHGPYIISEDGEAVIEDAAAGPWTTEIETACPLPARYSFRVGGSGTGVVAGVVKNRRGRMLSGVTVASSNGGIALTLNGYFVMVVPAGVHTLTVDAGFISQDSSTATVEAGSTANVSFEVDQTLPAIWLELDRTDYRPGDTPMIKASLYTGTSQNVVDAFVVLQAPDGTYYHYGSRDLATCPTVESYEVTDFENVEVPGHSITEDMAQGTWTYYGAFTIPGTWELVGDICAAPFQVLPSPFRVLP